MSKRVFTAAIFSGFLCLATTSRATIVGPYTPDASTLHLWHMDELAVPSVDSATSGGTNLVTIANGAALGLPSYTGFGTALSTMDGGQTTTLAGNKDAFISPSVANPPGNLASFAYTGPTNTGLGTGGAFTYEAIVQIGFDPAFNQGPTAAPASGNGRNAPCQILAAESGVNANRLFQWRIMPKGLTLIGTIYATNGPFLTFENVRGVVGNQTSIYAPIPMTGPDAIVSNGWYHVAVSYNGIPSVSNNIKFYWTAMDPSRTAANQIGITSAQTICNGPNPAGSFACAPVIGNEARSRAGAFQGQIDEVRISSVERDAVHMMFTSSALSFVSQSQSQLVVVGDTVTFGAVVGGESPRYQWQFNSTNVPNATNSSLILTNIAFSQSGPYQLVVTNSTSSITSSVINLTVGGAFSELYNTGVNGSKGLLSGGDIDPHWQMTQSGDPLYPGPNAVVVGSPPGTYLANGPSSMWLAPVANGSAAGNVNYTFHTTFLIDTLNPATAVLNGGWAMDNAGVDIILNGSSTGLTATGFGNLNQFVITNGMVHSALVDDGTGTGTLVSTNITNSFVLGVNTLDLIITNFPSAGANPTGLRAELRGIALPLPPTAPAIYSAPTNFTAVAQQSAAFSVAATGSGPLTYQWSRGGVNLANQTGRTLSLTGVTTADADTYTVTVSNSVSTASASATLTVVTPPALTWTGTSSGDWDTTTFNWLDGSSSAALFLNQDDVVFNAAGSGAPTVNLTAALSPNSILVDSTSDYTFSGAGSITGPTILVKTNSATLIIDTTNTYSGKTLIKSGTLQVGNNDANGSLGNSAISNNAALSYNRTDSFTVANIISGSGTVAMNGTGELGLSGHNTYSGNTLINAGKITARNSTALGDSVGTTIVASGAQLNIAADVDLGNEPLVLNGFGYAAPNEGALHKAGNGAGVNYGGPVTLATDSGIKLDSGAILNFINAAGINGTNTSLAVQGDAATSKGTVTGPLTLGTGSLTEYGIGTWVLVNPSNNWTGGTTLTGAGTLQIGDGGANGSIGSGPISLAASGILTFLSSTNLTVGGSISGTGVINHNGTGLLTLAAPSSYGGTTTIRGSATLRLGDSTALGSSTLTIGSAQTDTCRLELLGNLTIGNPITVFPRAFGSLNNPADILNVSGTNTLSPSSPITISAGGNLLSFQSDSGKLFFTGGLVGNGVGRYLVLKGASDGEISGPISATAGNSFLIEKLDAGTWTLSGANTPGGTTTISNGTLVLTGSIDTNTVGIMGGVLTGNGTIGGTVTNGVGGKLAPGLNGIGTLTINSNLILQAGSTTTMEVNKDAVSNDQIAGLSAVTYGGTLVITNLSGTLAVGDSYKLFAATTYAGSFSSITLPTLPSTNMVWNTGRLQIDGTVSVIAPPTAVNFGQTSLVSGTNLVLIATGGVPGVGFTILSSTNIATPLTNWVVAKTGNFDASGNLNVTNATATNAPQKFFILRIP